MNDVLTQEVTEDVKLEGPLHAAPPAPEPTELEFAQAQIARLKDELSRVQGAAAKSIEAQLGQAAKLEALTAKLKAYQRLEEHLIPLPNGELHRGFKATPKDNIDLDTEVIPEAAGNPLDIAVAKCLRAAKGGHALTCLWCGLQWGVPGIHNLGNEKELRAHLTKDHPSVVEGHHKMTSEILMANLAEAQARLEKQEA